MSIAKKPSAAVALAVLIAAASFIVALIAVSRVVAADYRFTRIVDSTMVEPDAFMFATIGYAYDFNNAGTVVFHASGNQGGKIYTGNGGPIHLVAEAVVNPTCCTSGVSVAISNFGASINDHGVVAFQKSTIDYNVPGDAFQGIYLSNGAIVYEAHSGDPSYKSAGQFTTINDNGDVAFRLQTPGGVDYVVVKSSGGVLATIAATSADGYRFVSWPLGINNAGKVVFRANPIVNGAVQPGYIYAFSAEFVGEFWLGQMSKLVI